MSCSCFLKPKSSSNRCQTSSICQHRTQRTSPYVVSGLSLSFFAELEGLSWTLFKTDDKNQLKYVKNAINSMMAGSWINEWPAYGQTIVNVFKCFVSAVDWALMAPIQERRVFFICTLIRPLTSPLQLPLPCKLHLIKLKNAFEKVDAFLCLFLFVCMQSVRIYFHFLLHRWSAWTSWWLTAYILQGKAILYS